MINNPKHIKGRFIGTYECKGSNSMGFYNFSEIRWTYLKIEDLVLLTDFDFDASKTGDFWFSEKIKRKTVYNFKFNNWNIPFKYYFKKSHFMFFSIKFVFPIIAKRTEIFIPKGETEYFSDDLHNVIIKNIFLNKDDFSFKQHSFIEVTGDIYFQVETKPVVIQKSIENKVEPIIKSTGSGVNIDESGNDLIESDNSEKDVIRSDSENQNPLVPKPIPNPLSNFKWIWNLLGILFWFGFLIFCWFNFPKLFYIFLFIGLGWLLTRFLGKSIFRKIFSFLLIFILFGIALTYFSNTSKNIVPVNTKDGKIKIYPPIKTDQKEGSKNVDYSFKKEIEWSDFIDNQYLAKYATSSLMFFETQKNHSSVDKIYSKTSANSITYYNKLYSNLEEFDSKKIDSIVKVLGKKSSDKKLNQIQTAEMVVTFIQYIPYVLVHQNSCEQVMQSEKENSFMVTYHQDKKTCLPNIPGGVQSPYEFLHNLKGDCDTRSLLGYAILKKMNISASVWVSQAYGHSILGVGLPIGNGVSKNINGLNHYGVELTQKDFRLGVISPQQRDMSNWNIALYFNNFK